MLISNVVKRPIVTEKSLSFGASENKYFFEVDMKASKGSVAKEVARIYGVDVQNVSTMIMPGKKRRVPKTNKFMKTKTCRLCKRESGNFSIILDRLTLCKTCFDFLLSKYGSVKKVARIVKAYKNGGRNNENK